MPNRNCATLLPIIEEFVVPGSTIHSDQWRANVGGPIDAIPVIPPYIHHSVNHTNHFVDPNNHACTNNVECFWKNLKMKNKAMLAQIVLFCLLILTNFLGGNEMEKIH